jgi:predicted nucleic acid-binding Zn ribbon protein
MTKILYDYMCPACGWQGELAVPSEFRDVQHCRTTECQMKLVRQLAAPMGRMWGVVPNGGGPDRFTADMMGIPLKDLPKDLKA